MTVPFVPIVPFVPSVPLVPAYNIHVGQIGNSGQVGRDGTVGQWDKSQKRISCQEANQLSIVSFLFSIGIEPKRISGNNYWYLSPMRQESSASFKVDVKLNRWYDHGIGQGGKLVDLGIKILNVPVKEFLDLIQNGKSLKYFSFHQPISELSNLIDIKRIKSLENKALIDYLLLRKISLSTAASFCQEVYYSLESKNYFGVGFRNDSSAFEIRNKYFKGCLGQKNISTIISNPSRVVLFEGFMDFLSAQEMLKDMMSQSSFIILNSVNQLPKAIEVLKKLDSPTIQAFFDNDDAGRRCFQNLSMAYPLSHDRSDLYRGYKDLNELLCDSTTVL